MKQITAITRKELHGYFSSPMALIFIGVFLAAVLFTFFWLDTFFVRGLADVRSLFRWMPLLLVFLIAALTMRQWSEEDTSGTLEILLTLPVAHWRLVLGKFLAVMTLVALTLALTISLPISVSFIGDLDWGPVLGGYLAALLLAAALVAIGLFVSACNRNEIVALIITSVIGLLLYVVGTPALTEFFGSNVGEFLRMISTNSRFASIQRGVVDLRDLAYYASLCALFLALNTLALDVKRWSQAPSTLAYRRHGLILTGLVALNLLALNVWLTPIVGARLDLTAQQEYTLSAPTRDLISNLQEPLLIRGHFSSRTHPLLAPLVPRITDTLREYEAISQGMINVEIVDPAQDPELEAEAAQTYGIRPTPFQIADRNEAAVVNAYFDILVRYGDQSEVLGFQDLIEVETFRDGEIDVRLRNLEYDLTRAVQRTVYGFQDIGSILDALPAPARITLYATPATLPPDLLEAEANVRAVAEEIAADSGGQLTFSTVDPDDPAAPVTRQELIETYGLQPFMVSPFSQETFFLHMVLELAPPADDAAAQARAAEVGAQVLYPNAGLTEAEIRGIIESGLQRYSSGFLQVVGVWQPDLGPDPTMAQFGQNQPPLFGTWDTVTQSLQEEYEVRRVDLSNGRVDSGIDVLVLIAPQDMTDVERYAIDQFLMRGGAVVAAVANFQPDIDPMTGQLSLTPTSGGINELLAHYGVNVEETLVLDPQNEPFPVAVQRDVDGVAVQEIQSLNYPYFVDVRSDGMASESALTSNLPAITLNWVSPVNLDEERAAAMDATVLLHSTDTAWTSADLNIQPDTETYPDQGFPVGDEQARHPLAVSMIGSFSSYFAGRPNPLQDQDAESNTGSTTATGTATTIEQSPGSARLVVVGSAHFLNDTIFTISSQLAVDRYLNSVRFVQNSVDWSVEDLDLLAIRARGGTARLLQPLTAGEETFWEFFNYAFALLSLVIIGITWANFRRAEQPMQLTPRAELGDQLPTPQAARAEEASYDNA